jgi:hypothetical protein
MTIPVITAEGKETTMQPGEVVDYLTYRSYYWNRINAPEISPTQWEVIYPHAWEYERKLRSENNMGDFDDIVKTYPHKPKVIAYAGIETPFADNAWVCDRCGSTDLRRARHDGQPQCACCGNDDFTPILRSVFIARELRGE